MFIQSQSIEDVLKKRRNIQIIEIIYCTILYDTEVSILYRYKILGIRKSGHSSLQFPYICLDFINNIYLAHLAVYGQKHLEAPGRVAYRNYNLM